MFATPLRVPKGSILKSVAHYDNSKENKSNPDASQSVYWGDQTWEEMQYTGSDLQRRQRGANHHSSTALNLKGPASAFAKATAATEALADGGQPGHPRSVEWRS